MAFRGRAKTFRLDRSNEDTLPLSGASIYKEYLSHIDMPRSLRDTRVIIGPLKRIRFHFMKIRSIEPAHEVSYIGEPRWGAGRFDAGRIIHLQ